MKKYFFIGAIFIFVFNQMNSFNTALACEAIKKQDIRTLEKILNNAVLYPQEKKVLLDCAFRAIQHHETTASISSTTKQSIFATACMASIGFGALCFECSVPSILLGMYIAVPQ
jgi:hypothetical protein